MRTKLFVLLAVGILMLTASCSRAVKDDTHSHDESLQLTAYNELFEVYAEVTPPVVGDTCEIVAHFTWLDSFKPLESGTIKATIGSTEQTLDTPTRLGIYKFHLVPASTGEACITFEITTPDGTSHLVTPTFTVCDDDHEAQHIAADLKAASSNGVVFTKEMSWKVDFATDSCRRELFGQVIRAMAQVQPSQGDERVVAAQGSGIVSAAIASLVEGSAVSGGQTLFSIESGAMAEGNLAVRYSEAESAYRLAKTEYERKQSLAADRIVSEAELQRAKANLEQAEAVYNNLRSHFSSGRLAAKSPINGYIKQLLVRSGEYVEAGQPLAVVSQNRQLMVRADVPSRYWKLLADITTATLRTTSENRIYSLEELGGKVVSYGRSVDLSSPMVPVTFEVHNVAGLLPGSIVEMFIHTNGNRPVVTIPTSALIEEMGNWFVYVQLTPEYFEKREVTVGQNDGLRTEITSGLDGTERVITRGAVLVKLTQMSGGLNAESGHQH